jgi:hypothetical protein
VPYKTKQESRLETMNEMKPTTEIGGEGNGVSETAEEASASYRPDAVTSSAGNSSCTQPHEAAAERPCAGHDETPLPSPFAPPSSSHDACSPPLHEFFYGAIGNLRLLDIVQDNAKGSIRRQQHSNTSSRHLEAIHEVAWKLGRCSQGVASDSVMIMDGDPAEEEDDDDDRMDPEEEEDLVRRIAMRFDSAGRLAAMAPKIPERRTSYETPEQQQQRRTSSLDEAASSAVSNANAAASDNTSLRHSWSCCSSVQMLATAATQIPQRRTSK